MSKANKKNPGDLFLVIGSNSFSGSHFVAHLLEKGAQVLGVSRSPEPHRVFLPYRWGDCRNFRFHQLDLNHDHRQMVRLIEKKRPAYVVNFAAQGMVAQSWEKPVDWFMTNTVAMVRLHDALRKFDFIKKFVQASTPEVYGNTRGAVRETAPFNPSTPYAISKAACDMSLLAYARAFDFPVALTRSANVCGPGQQLYRIIPKTILCILTGQKLKLEGGGLSVRSFIHIRDVCEGTWLAATRAPSGSIYHLSTDRRVTIRCLVELICRRLGANFADCVEVAPARKAQDAAYLLDWRKAREELKWRPRISLEKIVAETAAWTRKNLAVLRKQPAVYRHKQ
ncbi:MAG: GDP-mannose 4,6-dehydratase [Verrucomicrobiae bacterium]|nr:GDP-mannose 4,6-dehydratase [Verrucomicrobiae bacterium]